ncbi:sensor histidine kinase [Maribacter sp. MAR_2009_72]|uniref:sensor histidine kinase n=1 Tax=Maribacter sp. MAR_2009_72 TaxID=1250050 RepID=UPI00119B2663|nr:ATP-binding protein [Maribacter sp. MAR_2009_72]TVZ15737.1 two-component system phosphate regulon sensor histidine kinase PhoR [Maribacter sp. MAR_2009_72]
MAAPVRSKKSYRFAFRSSVYIALISTMVMAFLLWSFNELNWVVVIVTALTLFVTSFVTLQIRIDKFIYKKIKKIYDDVELLESSTLPSYPVTTDMRTLTAEIEKFAKDKKIEIDTLKIREEYRKDFLGNVSHELKTPLFTVQGYLETLLDGAIDDKNVRKKYIYRANKAVDRLIYIVKDLDLITKLEVGDLRLEKQSFNIIELIQSVFDLLEMKADKKNITLTFDIPYPKTIMVYADKEKIQQVLTNLLVNSIKYGNEKGTTEISVENLVKNKVIVRVTDNGEGIPAVHIPRLFERFYRVDQSGSRREGGSGLGLAIVKHVIEAHGEKIFVESAVEVGSEFSFTLEKSSSQIEDNQ